MLSSSSPAYTRIIVNWFWFPKRRSVALLFLAVKIHHNFAADDFWEVGSKAAPAVRPQHFPAHQSFKPLLGDACIMPDNAGAPLPMEACFQLDAHKYDKVQACPPLRRSAPSLAHPCRPIPA
jgi:hypothetical protein